MALHMKWHYIWNDILNSLLNDIIYKISTNFVYKELCYLRKIWILIYLGTCRRHKFYGTYVCADPIILDIKDKGTIQQ